MNIEERLRNLKACPPSIEFAKQYATLEEAWQACDNPKWLMWYARAVSGASESAATRKVVGVCAEIAELAYPLWEKECPNDLRVRQCLDSCKLFAEGRIGSAKLRLDAAAAAVAVADNNIFAGFAVNCAAHAADWVAATGDVIYSTIISSNKPWKTEEEILKIIRQHYPTIPHPTNN